MNKTSNKIFEQHPNSEEIMEIENNSQIGQIDPLSENSSVLARRRKLPIAVAREIKRNAKGKKIQPNPQPFPLTIYKIRKNSVCQMCSCQYEQDLQRMCQCEHQFCKNCLKQYFNYKLSMFEQVLCPSEECQHILDQEKLFYKKLPEALKKKYKKIHNFYKAAKNPNLKLCPSQQCEDGILNLVQGVNPTCDKCRKTYCLKCFLPVHDGSCDQKQAEFFEQNMKFRQCKKCKFVIERIEGCNHITCKCGNQFCYICGEQWDGNGHICPENQDQLENIEGILCDSNFCCGIPKLIGRLFFSFPIFVLYIVLNIVLFAVEFACNLVTVAFYLIPVACSIGCQKFESFPLVVLLLFPFLLIGALFYLMGFHVFPQAYVQLVTKWRNIKRTAVMLFR